MEDRRRVVEQLRLIVGERKSMDLRLGRAVLAPAPQPPWDLALSIANEIEIGHGYIRSDSRDDVTVCLREESTRGGWEMHSMRMRGLLNGKSRKGSKYTEYARVYERACDDL